MGIQPRGGADLRGLKALVGVLGVLVILGTALVIGVIIHRLYAKPVTPSIMPAQASLAPSGMVPGVAPALPAIANRLPAGDYIKAIAGAGTEVAVWVGGPDGDRILLVDPATGKVSVAISAAQ